MSTTETRRGEERIWTEDEFLALPVTKERTELLDGEVVREPSAGYGHQDIAMVLVRWLADWADRQEPRPTVVMAPLDIRFGPRRILQPDLAVFRERLRRDIPMPIALVPVLCVEVVSDRVYDRVTKRLIYAEAGVKEYWTVVPSLRMVERWTGPGLATRVECRERLVSETLGGFEMDVRALLAE